MLNVFLIRKEQMSPAENFLLGISASIYILTAVRFGMCFAPKIEAGTVESSPVINLAFVVMILLWPITTIIGIWFFKRKG